MVAASEAAETLHRVSALRSFVVVAETTVTLAFGFGEEV